MNGNMLFIDYYHEWVELYKNGAIRDVTLRKYRNAERWLRLLIPNVRVKDMDRAIYQKLMNDYAEEHEHATTMDFHHQVKSAVMDARSEGYIEKDPTWKAVIKGKEPRKKRPKFMSQYELYRLIETFKLGDKPNWDYLLFLIAKTGMRFAEALAVTPADFDFSRLILSISKTWDYKDKNTFAPTKNKSSVRRIRIDWSTASRMATICKGMPPDKPIFINGKKIYNSTVNTVLTKRCIEADVPIISIHGLRHTHASLCLYAGASIASVAKRLGHSNMSTTQKVYLHIIDEMDSQDTDAVMRAMSHLG